MKWTKQRYKIKTPARLPNTSHSVIGKYERDEVKPSIETATKVEEALEVSLDYLTGLSDLELDKPIVDVIMDIQGLDAKDIMQIMATLGAPVRNVKARNTYA